MSSRPTLEPILDADLDEFATFLNRHLDPGISAAAFATAFRHPWAANKPNNGFVLREDGELVGGLGAIYSDQVVRGETVRFCNVTSWCVLEAHRSQSMRLAMALTSQPGYHFTDLTPTEVVKGSLRFLKFKEMDPRIVAIPNLPWLDRATRILTDPNEIASVLSPVAARVYRDHLELPWLRHVAVGRDERYCHVAYKPGRVVGLPAALVVGLSDARPFLRGRLALGSHLLRHAGAMLTAVERRLLPERPAMSLERRSAQARMFRSDTLTQADISNLYTELAALDI